MTKIQKSEAEWRAELTPEQYHVLREKGTERPFTGEYDHTFEPGTYRCAGCGAELTPEQYHVLREKGTERPFTGEYDHTFEPGTYHCAGCGKELFTSDAKYDSGCGWPAFSAPASGEAVDEETDVSHGMVRTEVTCSACGGHLGHVFPDGPVPTGLRYCINSAALKHEPQ